MNKIVKIPDSEYKERIARAAQLTQEMGLDALIISSTESDYADVRYLSGFWPLFERAGVAVAANGESAMMVGVESDIFAADFGKIEKIFVLMEYRESADPDAPHLKPATFKDVLSSLGVTGDNIRIGVASWINTTLVIMDGIKDAYPKAEIVRADAIMKKLRLIKSENELACLRSGFEMAEYAVQEVLKVIKPGVTECQMVGVAQKAIYEMGAEYEGLPMYVFSEKSSSHAISRSRPDRIIGKNDIVQLNLSAKVDGYSPSIGLPICMGKLEGERREYIEFCLKMHDWTKERLKAGVLASSIAKDFYQKFIDEGYKQAYVYGPCHGTGMIEVEPPWMEPSSDYELQSNMAFQVDTFVTGPGFGCRWEIGVAITEAGYESLCQPVGKIYELGF